MDLFIQELVRWKEIIFSVGIQADGEFDCKGLEERIIELVSDEFPKESFKLITKNKKGDEVIYCKVATDLKGNPQKVGCKIAGKKTNHGEFEDVCKVGFFLWKVWDLFIVCFQG